MKIVKFTLLMLSLFLGCKDTTVSSIEESLELTINKSDFSLDEPIISNLSNQSSSSVFLYHCNRKSIPEIEKQEKDNWIIYYVPICPAIYISGVTEFESGKEIENSMTIKEAGIYRLRYSYSFTYNNSLDKILYSKEFKVE